jgi:aconitate decarboxylase
MGGNAKPELLYQQFGAPFRMVDPGLAYKKHPCNYFNHRPIDAALALREEYKIKPEQIARIKVIFPHFDYVDRPAPRTGLDGKFSVQYTTLIGLLDGEVNIDSFTNERRFAPDVAALLPKVELEFDDTIPLSFEKIHCTVDVSLKDGRQLSKRIDKLSGFVGFPLTREQRLKKFFSCAQRVLEENAAKRMLELVEQLETLSDVSEIMDIARCEHAEA